MFPTTDLFLQWIQWSSGLSNSICDKKKKAKNISDIKIVIIYSEAANP